MNRSRRVTTAQRIKYLFLLLMLVLSSNILTIQSALAESTQYFNEPFASSGSFTVPAGVTSVTVELWGGGGGGGGGGNSNKNGGGGGAGGQYARKAVTVTPGNSYSVIVGNGGSAASNTNGGAGGDSTFNGTAVVAKGGTGGQWYNNGGAGGNGSTSGGVGDVVYAGGSGVNGAAAYSGGGGSGAGWAAGQTNVLVTYGEWYHLAASWDGAVVRVYVNGEFNKQYNLASYVNSTAPTRIGASSDGANYQLKGSVANVRIYESALSAAEIKSIYDKGLEGSPFILKGQN